jgi:hypothetical protein
MNTISLQINGEKISVVDHDFFVSDNARTLLANFEFDGTWNDYVKFWSNSNETQKTPLARVS